MYTAINNFKYGLDSRRSELSSVPGSLIEALDGHITQGGEFEKRKSFVKFSRPSGTIGFQDTSKGIYVFGTAASSAVTVVPPILYQQLLHPKTLAGLGAVALTSIVSSTKINDYPWVVALFADGTTYTYYNGQLVTDFVYGYVANYMTTNSLIASNISQAINSSVDYTSVQDASTLANEVNAFSLPGNGYSVVASLASTANITVTTTQDVNYTQANVYATSATNSNDGSLLTLGGQVYRFKLVMSQAFDVQIGETIASTLTNLFLAINATGVAGTNYFTGTTKNAVIYAQYLAIGTTPTFQVVSFLSNTLVGNTQDIVQNDISSIQYTNESPTVAKAIATQSVGQFTIEQVAGSIQATDTVGFNANPVANGSTLVIQGVTYTFKTTPTTNRDIQRFTATMFGVFANELTALAAIAIINGNTTFMLPGGHVITAGIVSQPDANVTASIVAVPGFNNFYFQLSAIAIGVLGNGITVAVTGSLIASTGTLSGGATSSIASIVIGAVGQGILSTGTITTNGTNVSNGDTVTLGSLTYTFVTAAPSSTWQVAIGANAQASLTNLLLAINGTGTQLLNYDIANVNPQAQAVATLNGNTLQVNSRIGGTASNSINLTTTAVTLTASAPTLLGGADSITLVPSAIVSTQNQTAAQFAATVLSAINANSINSGYYANTVGNVVYIYSTAGNIFSNSAVITVTVVGSVCIGFCEWEFNAATFNGTGPVTGSLTSIQVDGLKINSHTHGLGASATNPGQGDTNNTVDTTITGMCADIVLDINANSVNYTSISVNNIIYLSKLVTTSNDAPLNVVLTMTAASADKLAVSQLGQANLVAVATPNYIGFVRYPAGTQTKNTIFTSGGIAGSAAATGILLGDPAIGPVLKAFGLGKHKGYITAEYSPIICSCQASGGYPPYTYLWTFAGGDNGFVVSNPTQPNITFSRPDNAGTDQATFVCIVSDSLGNQVTSNSVTVFQP